MNEIEVGTPADVTLNVTDRCDAACVYCHYWRRRSVDRPLCDIQGFIRDCAREGVPLIRLSGGEPLLRADLETIVTSCCEEGLTVMLITAGRQEGGRLMRIVECGVSILSISLDCVDAEVFYGIRGYTIDPVLRNLEMLERARASNGFEIILSLVLTSRNMNLLEGVIGYAIKKDFAMSVSPVHGGDLGSAVSSSAFTPHREACRSSIQKAVDELKNAAGEGLRLINSDTYLENIGAYMTGQAVPETFRCTTGYRRAIFTPKLSLKLCHSLGEIEGDGFRETWYSTKAMQTRKRMRNLDCARCWLSCHADTRRNVINRFVGEETWRIFR